MLCRKTFHTVNSRFFTQGCTRVTYRSASKFYDLLGSKRDLAFYRDVACQSGTEALELGVGTGRVALALAHAGIQVLGLDSSSHMLGLAREKLAKEPEATQRRVTLRLGDMRNFDLNRSFPSSTFPPPPSTTTSPTTTSTAPSAASIPIYVPVDASPLIWIRHQRRQTERGGSTDTCLREIEWW